MKAILVIDIPDDFDTKTAIAIVDVKNEKGEGVTAMCPIKPLPDKKPVSYHDDLFGDIEKNFTNIGWNSCLDEIEKPEAKSDLSTDEGWWKDYELYEMQND